MPHPIVITLDVASLGCSDSSSPKMTDMSSLVHMHRNVHLATIFNQDPLTFHGINLALSSVISTQKEDRQESL